MPTRRRSDGAWAELAGRSAWHRAEPTRYEGTADAERLASGPASRVKRIMIESGIGVSRAMAEWAEWSLRAMEHDR